MRLLTNDSDLLSNYRLNKCNKLLNEKLKRSGLFVLIVLSKPWGFSLPIAGICLYLKDVGRHSDPSNVNKIIKGLLENDLVKVSPSDLKKYSLTILGIIVLRTMNKNARLISRANKRLKQKYGKSH